MPGGLRLVRREPRSAGGRTLCGNRNGNAQRERESWRRGTTQPIGLVYSLWRIVRRSLGIEKGLVLRRRGFPEKEWQGRPHAMASRHLLSALEWNALGEC